MTKLPERNLDVLRTTAVACVLADHLAYPWTSHIGPVTTWDLGRIGVLLFFVHTSLVLMASLERICKPAGHARHWVAQFYVRRAFRIYPFAIATVIATVMIGIPSAVRSLTHPVVFVPPDRLTVLANLALVQNILARPDLQGVLWSLPLEVQMYVLLPALYLVARKERSWPVLAAFAAVSAASLAVRFAPIPGIWRLTFLIYGPCFMSGVLAYHLARRARPRVPAWGWPLVLVTTFCVFLASQPDAWHPERGWLACLVLGAMIPFVRDLPESFATRAAAQVAKYSYGVYLVHRPLLWVWFIQLGSLPRAAQWGGWTLSLVAVSVGGYHLLEEPLINLGRSLAGWIGRTAPAREPIVGAP